MEAWYIRLGHNEKLAKEYSIISIGYAIDEDITKIKYVSEIAKQLKEILIRQNIEATPHQIYARARLIDKFINRVKIEDTIISPLSNGYLKIGKVISECHTIESFFKEEEKFDEFMDKFPYEERVKPAIKVNWVAEVNLQEFPLILQTELRKSMPATITKLNISDSNGSAIIALVKQAEAKKARTEYEEAREKYMKAQEEPEKHEEHGKIETTIDKSAKVNEAEKVNSEILKEQGIQEKNEHLEEKRRDAEDKENEAKQSIGKAENEKKKEQFSSRVNTAAGKAGVYAAIISAVISIPASRIAMPYFPKFGENDWIAILVVIIFSIIAISMIIKSEWWNKFCLYVKSIFEKLRNWIYVWFLGVLPVIKAIVWILLSLYLLSWFVNRIVLPLAVSLFNIF